MKNYSKVGHSSILENIDNSILPDSTQEKEKKEVELLQERLYQIEQQNADLIRENTQLKKSSYVVKEMQRIIIIVLVLLLIGLATLYYRKLLLIWRLRKLSKHIQSNTKHLQEILELPTSNYVPINSTYQNQSYTPTYFRKKYPLLNSIDQSLAINELQTSINKQKAMHQLLLQTIEKKEDQLKAFNYSISHDLKIPLISASNILQLIKIKHANKIEPLLPYLDSFENTINEMNQ
ncbi:MAG: hypothetical protein AAFO07_32540, partial [Bacteroidota bacterium]